MRFMSPDFTARSGLIFALMLSLFAPAHAAGTETIRIMTVVICQQEDFLRSLLAPWAKDNQLDMVYTQGHHTEVAEAVEKGEVDFVITHAKVKKMQKLEALGVLGTGRQVFANPMVFLGPIDDPAAIDGLKDSLAAQKQIQQAGICTVINSHERLGNIQRKLLAQVADTAVCVIDSDGQDAVDLAYELKAYTLWALHPYARKSRHRLRPVLIAHDSLLENMEAWVVEASPLKHEAQKLLDYLGTEKVQAQITGFRLQRYPDIQAWWLPR